MIGQVRVELECDWSGERRARVKLVRREKSFSLIGHARVELEFDWSGERRAGV